MDDDVTTSPKKDKKKARSKSRTRTMFGLKQKGTEEPIPQGP